MRNRAEEIIDIREHLKAILVKSSFPLPKYFYLKNVKNVLEHEK